MTAPGDQRRAGRPYTLAEASALLGVDLATVAEEDDDVFCEGCGSRRPPGHSGERCSDCTNGA
jgi:hypothetical protein